MAEYSYSVPTVVIPLALPAKQVEFLVKASKLGEISPVLLNDDFDWQYYHNVGHEFSSCGQSYWETSVSRYQLHH